MLKKEHKKYTKVRKRCNGTVFIIQLHRRSGASIRYGTCRQIYFLERDYNFHCRAAHVCILISIVCGDDYEASMNL